MLGMPYAETLSNISVYGIPPINPQSMLGMRSAVTLSNISVYGIPPINPQLSVCPYCESSLLLSFFYFKETYISGTFQSMSVTQVYRAYGRFVLVGLKIVSVK